MKENCILKITYEKNIFITTKIISKTILIPSCKMLIIPTQLRETMMKLINL